MKGAQKNFPYDDNIDGTFVRCSINKPYSRECNHELCALKSNKTLYSTVFDIHFMMILANIFLGTDKRVIPLQMLQSLRVPVFGILQMTSRFMQSIYFVTLFGISSQSANQHGFV